MYVYGIHRYIFTLLKDDEALYLDSGPVIDSREGGPEESVSELEYGTGSTGGYAVENPLLRYLGQETGCLSGRSTPADRDLDFYCTSYFQGY